MPTIPAHQRATLTAHLHDLLPALLHLRAAQLTKAGILPIQISTHARLMQEAPDPITTRTLAGILRGLTCELESLLLFAASDGSHWLPQHEQALLSFMQLTLSQKREPLMIAAEVLFRPTPPRSLSLRPERTPAQRERERLQARARRVKAIQAELAQPIPQDLPTIQPGAMPRPSSYSPREWEHLQRLEAEANQRFLDQQAKGGSMFQD